MKIQRIDKRIRHTTMCRSIERPCAFQLSSGARDNNNNTRIGERRRRRDVLESKKYLV